MEALIGTVISLISPYLVKGAEEFAKSAGAAAFEGTKALVERMAKWWRNDPVAEAAAKAIPQDPKRYAAVLADQLAHDLPKDEVLAADLRRLVSTVGPSAEIVQKIKFADGVTGADIVNFIKGRISIHQEIDVGRNVVGVKIKDFGG